MNWYKHLRTINGHKRLVLKYCFACGLYWQGITHDLSKYSFVEFLVGVKYYQGHRSPNAAEREDKGYTLAWLHHKGRNKHHLEYWLDYNLGIDYDRKPIIGCAMPKKYVVEMFCDRIAASRNYNPTDYNNTFPLMYYENGRSENLLHPDTRELLELLLNKLAYEGEEVTFKFIKQEIFKKV